MKYISRRTLLAAGATAAGLAALPGPARTTESEARPNILWLVSEDNSPLIGAYGDSIAHTPTLDALAEAGVLYANAFSTAPVCAPSRFAIISGMYAETAGPAQQMRAAGRIPAFLQGFPKYLRDVGYYCTNNAKTDYNAAFDMRAMWNESGERAHWRNRPDGAPFFAVFNFMTTHESRMFANVAGRVRPEDVRVPAYLPDVPEVRRDISSYYNLIERMDGEVAAHLTALDAAGLADDTIVFYYSDNGGIQPRSKRYCYDEGLRTALVVRVPAKWAHLAPSPPGSVVSSPVCLIDLAPTVLAMAGRTVPSHMQGEQLAGQRRRPRRRYAFGGRDRMDERYDLVRTARDERYRYIRNYSPHRIYGQHVAFEWQLDSYRAWESAHLAHRLSPVQERFFREKPAEELYDLAVDTDQIHNLVRAPQHRKRVEAMSAALDAHMLEINDNGFIPEGSSIEGYEASRARGAYPLKEVLLLAGKVIRRDSGNVGDLGRMLSHSNEVIRYWAAQGLLMLGGKASSAQRALEIGLATDTSIPVRIVCAETLAGLGQTDATVRYLGEVVRTNGNARLRLQALNALTWIGEPAGKVLSVIDQAAEAEDNYVRNAARYLSFVLKGTYTPSAQVYLGVGARIS